MVASRRLLERLEQVKKEVGSRSDLASQISSPRAVAVLEAADSPAQRRVLAVGMADTITFLNANSSPVEFLVSNGDMEFGEDEDGMAGVRFHTAIRFRDLVGGAQVRSLKSNNLEAVGGGGFGPVDILSYQMDCRKILMKVRESIGQEWIYTMLEAVVVYDDWLDLWPEPAKNDKRGVKRKQRLKTITALHYAIDKAGEVLGYMNRSAFMIRWGRGVPAMPPSVRRRIQASMVEGPLVPRT